VLLYLRDMVVSDFGKGIDKISGMNQEDERKQTVR
jgi:hypothetical protein